MSALEKGPAAPMIIIVYGEEKTLVCLYFFKPVTMVLLSTKAHHVATAPL